MKNLYEDSEGVLRQSQTDNHFGIREYPDCTEVVFVMRHREVPIATFDSTARAESAYNGALSHAVTVNDAIIMIKERQDGQQQSIARR